MYVGNNPINNNDPDGRCYPVCTAIIGAAIGSIVGAVAYTANNNGSSFDAGEFWIAVGVGAISGGLIGTGVGILAMPGASVAALAVSPKLIGGGVSAITTATGYITNNKNKFDSKSFLLQTTISGVAGAATSDPTMSLKGKWARNLMANELSYYLTDEYPSFTGGLAVAGSTTLSAGFQLGFDSLAENHMTVSAPWMKNIADDAIPFYMNRYASTVASSRAKDAISSVVTGFLSGVIQPTSKRVIKKLIKIEME